MSALLAIETSQRRGGVALRPPEGPDRVEMLAAAARHDDDLLPAVDRVLRGCGLGHADLGAIGVSIGPGGFTGLRIAITTAKVLAETLGLRLLAVPSAMVAAESFSRLGRTGGTARGRGSLTALSVLAAKRGSAWCTRLELDTNRWRVAGEPGLASSLELTGVDIVLADRHLPAAMRQASADAGIMVATPDFDPRACLRVAGQMLEAGETADVLGLRLLYPRPPEAVTVFDEKRRGGAGPDEPSPGA